MTSTYLSIIFSVSFSPREASPAWELALEIARLLTIGRKRHAMNNYYLDNVSREITSEGACGQKIDEKGAKETNKLQD